MSAMTGTLISEPPYFHRQYENDIPKKEKAQKKEEGGIYDQCVRVGLVALPIISLYRPFSKSLSLFSDCSRTITSLLGLIQNLSEQNIKGSAKASLDLLLAISSLAATIFLHPLGMCITTAHDICISLYKIYLAINEGNKEEVIKQLLQITTNSLYLALMVYGSLEMQIASLALQVIWEGFNSLDELKNKNYLEFASHLLMAAIRMNQMIPQLKLLKQQKELQAAIQKLCGDLHEKWQFPSDHLPIGIVVDGMEIISFNVLNDAYIEWIYKDTQGLNHSLITELDKKINDEGLTLRDKYVIDMILKMLSQSDNRALLCLQECSPQFLKELENSLPSNWNLIKSDSKLSDQNVVLYNSDKLKYIPEKSEISFDGYPCDPGRSILSLLFQKKDGQNIRIFNTHVPGDPSLPGLDEFAKFIKDHSNPDEINVALGDLNFERNSLEKSLDKVNLKGCDIYSPYNTNIDPLTKEGKCIDHIIVFGKKVPSKELTPNEVLEGLQKTTDLIAKPQNKDLQILPPKNKTSFSTEEVDRAAFFSKSHVKPKKTVRIQ